MARISNIVVTLTQRFTAFEAGMETFRNEVSELRAAATALTEPQKVQIDKAVVESMSARLSLPMKLVDNEAKRVFSGYTISGDAKTDRRVNAARSRLSYIRSILKGSVKAQATKAPAAHGEKLTIKDAAAFLEAQIKSGNTEARQQVKALLLMLL